jgi:hypothetical protein
MAKMPPPKTAKMPPQKRQKCHHMAKMPPDGKNATIDSSTFLITENRQVGRVRNQSIVFLLTTKLAVGT